MFRALVLTLRQLGDPAILRVLAKSLAVTLVVFLAGGFGLFELLRRWLAGFAGGHDDGLAGVAAIAIGLLAGWLLFRVVAIAIIGLFADDIVAAVETRHYPAAFAAARPVGVARAARMGLASALRACLVNLLMVPVYLALLFTAVGPVVAFTLVNAWLLGRDLGDMVASRHLDDATMRGWRRSTAVPRFVLGLVATGLFVVPLLGLLAPIVGAAMATHLFHGGKT
ncbi:EI24 domain-containing protein [Sphingomonas beigongshangi]|uniref:EI24 domain-containing protein n=1 Tax=Sphingomonas beigongshangi TaxID=2782540 RepID=UPI001AEEB796|nr:EI24 domain-containing protein [Sphingomonas beigongshangi]